MVSFQDMGLQEDQDEFDPHESMEVHEGHRGMRITVDFPESLPELRHHADKNFGKSRRLRMYHMGHRLMHHPSQLRHLRDGDHVVVKPDVTPPRQHISSSYQDEYMEHVPAASRPVFQPETLSKDFRGPFSGCSRYKEDFLGHPAEKRPPVQRMGTSVRLKETTATGRTSYADHFPWMDNRPRPRAPRTDLSRLTMEQQEAPFAGQTHYSEEFIARPINRTMPCLPVGQKKRPAKFEGMSTYIGDYVEPLEDGRMPSAKPSHDVCPKVPLEGMSEYLREYIKRDLNQKSVVHLEPHKATMSLSEAKASGIFVR